MDEHSELITRLSTAAGTIMEDACPAAIIIPAPSELGSILAYLEEATSDANLLIRAAQVLARRDPA